MHSGSADEKKIIPISLKMADGETMFGKLLVRKTIQSLADALNKPEPFVEFETADGEQMHLAKSGISSIKMMEVPKAGQLDKDIKDDDNFNPFRVLKVTPESTPEEMRASYLALARSYHPDVYAQVDLPKEVQVYMATMLKRINVAYQMAMPKAPMPNIETSQPESGVA